MRIFRAAFDESKHPRKGGKFVKKGTGDSGKHETPYDKLKREGKLKPYPGNPAAEGAAAAKADDFKRTQAYEAYLRKQGRLAQLGKHQSTPGDTRTNTVKVFRK